MHNAYIDIRDVLFFRESEYRRPYNTLLRFLIDLLFEAVGLARGDCSLIYHLFLGFLILFHPFVLTVEFSLVDDLRAYTIRVLTILLYIRILSRHIADLFTYTSVLSSLFLSQNAHPSYS